MYVYVYVYMYICIYTYIYTDHTYTEHLDIHIYTKICAQALGLTKVWRRLFRPDSLKTGEADAVLLPNASRSAEADAQRPPNAL